ncbi:MAG TPA: glycosyltransferase, partial [Longimicrobiales bacterium]|nr:glycosyltransferase [Longimicrobiales bacterium]
MRLLFLNHNVAFQGTFFRAHQLARELTGRGHEVTLVTTSRRARLRGRWREVHGVSVYEAPDLLFGPGRTGWDAWNAVRRVLALRRRRFDVVHAFDGRPVVIGPALEVRRRTGARLVMDWADWWGRGGRIEERSGAVVRTLVGPVETWFEEAFRT